MTDDDDDDDPDKKRYRKGDPDTSRMSAKEIRAFLSRLRAEVLIFYMSVKRATQLDVEKHFENHSSSYRSRVPELCARKFLHYTGEKVQQVGPNGSLRYRRVYALGPKPT